MKSPPIAGCRFGAEFFKFSNPKSLNKGPQQTEKEVVNAKTTPPPDAGCHESR